MIKTKFWTRKRAYKPLRRLIIRIFTAVIFRTTIILCGDVEYFNQVFGTFNIWLSTGGWGTFHLKTRCMRKDTEYKICIRYSNCYLNLMYTIFAQKCCFYSGIRNINFYCNSLYFKKILFRKHIICLSAYLLIGNTWR